MAIAQSQLIHVMIRNREKVIFDGDATALTSVNDRGIFDILPQHINFITMIKKNLLIHKADGTKQEYKIRTGIMRVTHNSVELYVGLADTSSPTPLGEPPPTQ